MFNLTLHSTAHFYGLGENVVSVSILGKEIMPMMSQQPSKMMECTQCLHTDVFSIATLPSSIITVDQKYIRQLTAVYFILHN